MSFDRRYLVRNVLIWSCLGAPPFVAAGEPVTGDLGRPVSATGTSPQALYFVQPLAGQSLFFQHGDPTAHEQYMLELINRARANPNAEALRLGIDLNQGLAPGTISSTPKPPLAFHPQLIDSARTHSQWMLDTGTFSHTGSGGSNPGDRMTAAGYPFAGRWGWGENIGWKGTTGLPDLTGYTAEIHDNLFLSPGHRTNLMDDDFDEVGIGLIDGVFQQYNALMATQNFTFSGGTPGPLATGVVYDDRNGNRFYDVGEGIAGVNVELTGGDYYTVTSIAGGFALPYDGVGEFELIFSGGGLSTPSRMTFTGAGRNIKQDLVVTDQPVNWFESGAADAISWFYAAAFARTPVPNSMRPNYGDLGGLIYWTNQYLGGPAAQLQFVGDVFAIADFFVVSAEFQMQYPASLTNGEFVTALYQNMLGREPDEGGWDYWVGSLNSGTSRGTVLALFTNSAENRSFNPLRQQALASFIAFIAADDNKTITTDEAAVWLTINPGLDGALVDGN